MSSNFAVGDVVVLKSGGPLMTVDVVNEQGHVRCIWFEGSSVQGALFRAETLKTSSM